MHQQEINKLIRECQAILQNPFFAQSDHSYESIILAALRGFKSQIIEQEKKLNKQNVDIDNYIEEVL